MNHDPQPKSDGSPHLPILLNTFQAKDDTLDCDIKTEEISPRDQMTTLSYQNLKILLGKFILKDESLINILTLLSI